MVLFHACKLGDEPQGILSRTTEPAPPRTSVVQVSLTRGQQGHGNAAPGVTKRIPL